LLRVKNGATEVLQDGAVIEQSTDNPLDFIDAYYKRFKVAMPAGLPRFCGGLAGYFGYDAARYIEARLARSAQRHTKPDPVDLPDIQLLLTEELAVIDNLTGRLHLILYADPSQPQAYARGQARLAALRAQLRNPVEAPELAPGTVTPIEREFDKADYLRAVAVAKEFIAAGD
ncbi:MAG: anthranilate synthase component I, partial [Tepidimonas sp.]